MNFSTEYLSRYEENIKNTKTSLKEKEEFIATLEANSQKALSEKEATIASQKDIIKGKDDENAKLQDKIKEYERKEAEAAEKARKKKNIAIFFGKILLVFILVILSIFLENVYQSQITEHFSTAVGLISSGSLFQKDIKNIFKTKNKTILEQDKQN